MLQPNQCGVILLSKENLWSGVLHCKIYLEVLWWGVELGFPDFKGFVFNISTLKKFKNLLASKMKFDFLYTL
jgi:hypothetical protein